MYNWALLFGSDMLVICYSGAWDSNIRLAVVFTKVITSTLKINPNMHVERVYICNLCDSTYCCPLQSVHSPSTAHMPHSYLWYIYTHPANTEICVSRHTHALCIYIQNCVQNRQCDNTNTSHCSKYDKVPLLWSSEPADITAMWLTEFSQDLLQVDLSGAEGDKWRLCNVTLHLLSPPHIWHHKELKCASYSTHHSQLSVGCTTDTPVTSTSHTQWTAASPSCPAEGWDCIHTHIHAYPLQCLGCCV